MYKTKNISQDALKRNLRNSLHELQILLSSGESWLLR